MQLALDALEAHLDIGIRSDRAIDALRAELAKPEPEPVACMWKYIGKDGYPKLIGNGLIARSSNEMDPENPPYPDTWHLEYALYRKEDI